MEEVFGDFGPEDEGEKSEGVVVGAVGGGGRCVFCCEIVAVIKVVEDEAGEVLLGEGSGLGTSAR